jgi:hypothetical protein
MQITIVQAEIEQAIRNYIQDQINVKDGMRIDIALKATRGEEGTTAIIDIVKDEVVLTGKKVETKAEAVVTKSTASVPAPVKKESPELPKFTPEASVPVASQGKEEVLAQPAGSTDSGPSTDSTEPTNTAEAGTAGDEPPVDGMTQAAAEPSSTEAAQSTTAEEVAAKPAGRSLFPNLKRIQNA